MLGVEMQESEHECNGRCGVHEKFDHSSGMLSSLTSKRGCEFDPQPRPPAMLVGKHYSYVPSFVRDDKPWAPCVNMLVLIIEFVALTPNQPTMSAWPRGIV